MKCLSLMVSRWSVAGSLLAALLSLSASPGVARADDMKSWILGSNNWQQAKDLLPEVALNRVKNGDYWYKVQPVDPEKFKQNYPKKFWEASEANAGKYDVDPETCGLRT